MLAIRAETAAIPAFHRLVGRHETTLGGIEDIHLHADRIRHIDGSPEILGLARGIHDLDRDLVQAALPGGKDEGERAVRGGLDLLLGDDLPVTQDLCADIRPGQAVARIGRDPSADLGLFPDQVEFIHRVILKREGRQHELIHAERAPSDVVLALVRLQGEHAAPLAFRQDEFAGDGTEVIGFQRLFGNLFALGVDQLDIQRDAREHRYRFGQVALEEHTLETQGIPGIESPPVEVEVALGGLLLLRDGLGEITDGYLGAAADSSVLALGLGLDGIIDPAVAGKRLLHIGRDCRKSVELQGLGGNGLVVLAQDQSAVLQRLPAEIIGHIDGISIGLAAMREGKGVAAIGRPVLILAGSGHGGVVPVVQHRNGDRDAVQGIETVRRIAHGPAFHDDVVLALQPFHFRLAQVAESQDERILLDGEKQGFFTQRLQQVVRFLAAFDDAGVSAGEFVPVGDIALAVGLEGLEVIRSPALGVQLVEAHPEQVLPGPEGDGAHRRVGGQGLQGGLAEFLSRVAVRGQASRDIVSERRPGRVTVPDLFPEQLVDFILLRLLIGHFPLVEEVPEDVFAVVGDELLERAVEIRIQIAVELRMMSLGESVVAALDILPALFGGFVAELLHPGVGYDRLVEALHESLQLGPERILELPVAALHRIDILLAGVVEVGAQMLAQRFVADLLEDFGFLLGAVGLLHLFVFRPAGGEDVSVRVHVSRFIGFFALRKELSGAGHGDQEGRAGEGGERKEEGGLPFHIVSKYVMASLTTKVEPPM